MWTSRLTEKAFQQQILDLAQICGWKAYHPYLSIKSATGFPDLTLAKSGQPVVFAELKVGTNRLTIAQMRWRDVLQAASGCEWYCWYPEDWPSLERRLMARPIANSSRIMGD